MSIEPIGEQNTVDSEGFGPITAMEPGFGSTEFSNKVDIHTSKLRRWSIELEKNGYEIMRDHSNNRIYLQSDIPTFLKLKEFIEVRKIPVEESYKSVSSMFRDYRHRLQTAPSVEENKDKQELVTMTKDDFQDMVKAFGEQAERAALIAAEEVEKRFLEVLSNRDSVLVQSLKQGMENQRLLTAATVEEEPVKKSFFARVFGK